MRWILPPPSRGIEMGTAPGTTHSPAAPAVGLMPTLAMASACLGLAVCLVLKATDGLSAWTFEEQRVTAASRGKLMTSPISVLDAEGRSLTVFDAEQASSSRDDMFLVDFIYTRCPSVCQALGSEFFRMQAQLAHDVHGGSPPTHRVRLLSISLDPAHDGPDALAAYGELHRADPAYWTLASPRTVAAGRALMRDLGVIAIPDGSGGFVHNAGIHLIDGQGRLRAIFPYDQWQSALAAARRGTMGTAS